jgi:hypothetical protein
VFRGGPHPRPLVEHRAAKMVGVGGQVPCRVPEVAAMRGVVKLGLILVPILLVLGLVLNAIYKVRVLPHWAMLPCADCLGQQLSSGCDADLRRGRQDLPTVTAIRHSHAEPDLLTLLLPGLVHGNGFG